MTSRKSLLEIKLKDIVDIRRLILNGNVGYKYYLRKGLEELYELSVGDYEQSPILERFQKAAKIYSFLLDYFDRLCKDYPLLKIITLPYRNEYQRLLESPQVREMEFLTFTMKESAKHPVVEGGRDNSERDGIKRIAVGAHSKTESGFWPL